MWLQKAAAGHPNTSEDVLHSSTFMPSQLVDSARKKREEKETDWSGSAVRPDLEAPPFNSNRLPAIPGGPQGDARGKCAIVRL